MAPIAAFLAFVALAPPAPAGDDLPAGVLLLSRIKRHVRDEVARLPDYTCLQTVLRYHHPAGKPMPRQPSDTVILGVLFSGGKELYGSPGERNFWHENPSSFTAGGLSGNGVFALHLQTLFVDDVGMFTYQGEEDFGGRRAVRYDYRVPLLFSGFTIHMAHADGRVAMSGSFWADPETLDLLRLDVLAQEIPSNLALSSAFQSIEYARMRIGDRDIRLPQRAELEIVNEDGEESRNELEFTHCQSFAAESRVSFDAPEPPAGLPPATTAAVPLAAPSLMEGLTVTIELAAPITDRDAVGSLIEARVASDVKERGKIVIRADTAVRGRIRRLERTADAGSWAVGLEFTHIETARGTARFYANVQDLEKRRDVKWMLGHDYLPPLPGVASFFVAGSRLELPAGFRTVWKTKTPR